MFMATDQSASSPRQALLEHSRLHLYSLNYSRAHGVLGIGYHPGRYMSRATREFIRIAREHIAYPAEDGSQKEA